MENSQNPFKLLEDENEKMPKNVQSEMQSTIDMTKMASLIIDLFVSKAGSTLFTLMGGADTPEEKNIN